MRQRSNDFDPRHDLVELANKSGFYEIVPASEIDRLSALFSSLNRRWRSNHRYYSNRQFLDYMNEIRAEYNSRGNRWKNIARTLLVHAYTVLKLGEEKWTRK